MDLDQLKGKTLDDATHAELVKFVQGEQAKVQAARDESINHRKGLKERAEKAEKHLQTALDKLGVDTADELAELPDAKGQAEATKQLEAQVKRLTRERDEATKQSTTLQQERDTDRRRAAIAQAVAKHNFADAEVAALLIERGLKVEGDQVLFEAEGGKLVPLDEGAAWIAKTKPHLVKAQGGTGSGHKEGGGGSGGGALPKKPERKDYTDEVAYFRDAARYDEQQQKAS